MKRTRSQTVLHNDMPSIQSVELTDEQLTSYLSDLFSGGQHVQIRVKDSAQSGYRSMRLAELHVAVLNRHVWGAELGYDLSGVPWVDTLTVEQQTVRLVHKQQATVLSA
jgi:hypothetical protein